MNDTILRTPLYNAHVALGGKIVPFAGYELPVQYTGIIAETKAVREGVGMFDVSHMARLWFEGERVVEFLSYVTANDVAALEDGRGHYSLFPNSAGGAVDDIIVYRIRDGVFRMVVNAANHAKDVAHLNKENRFGVKITDETDATAMIAVQGPKALETLARLSDGASFVGSDLFDVFEAKIAGVDCFAPRSGYTGEDGCELVCRAEDGPKLWQALLDAGVTPCGLGSRDTLRVEAGLPLYGHELTDELGPIEAGLGWVVRKTGGFIGAEIIEGRRANGVPKKIHGVRLEGKRLPMPGMEVSVDGAVVGALTSGVYSPTLDCGIGFALVDSKVKLGTPCTVNVRGQEQPGTIVSKRFLKQS